MKLQCFSILDLKAAAYLPPICCRTTAEAIRMFENALQDNGTQFARNPGDYVLHRVGEFDDASGLMVPEEPVRLVSGQEAVNQAMARPGTVPN